MAASCRLCARVISDADDSAVSAVALAVSAAALGQAVQVAQGNLHPRAIGWLTLALLGCVAAVLASRSRRLEALGSAPSLVLAGVAIAVQLIQLSTAPPGMYVQLASPRGYIPFFSGMVIAALLAGAGYSRSPGLGAARIPLLLTVHFLLGVWMIRATPNPYIDVYFFQRDSLGALLRGVDPYAITFPNIYGDLPFYGPGVSVGGRLSFGFPYPPLSLLLALPGHLLTGDYRYSQLAAITLSGALIAYSRPGALAAFAATLFLFTPRVLFVLEQGWTEPFVLLALTATVFAAIRAPRLVPFFFGLFLASKQYAFLACPALALLLPRPFQWKAYAVALGKSALVVAVITAPFFFWGIAPFVRSVVTLQFYQPFRSEALSYLVWFARGDQYWPTWVAFVFAAVGAALAVWRGAHSPTGFASAVALTLVGFFAFNKQAFCNYYFLVIGACALGLGAACLPRRTTSASERGPNPPPSRLPQEPPPVVVRQDGHSLSSVG